jgi:hypothetical protein
VSEQVLVVPDLHCPYHDPKVWSCILETIRVVKPSGVVVIGDFADFYSISRHRKDPRRARVLFEDELEAVKRERRRLEKAAGKAWLHFTKGNHENRLDNLVADEAPAVSGLVDTKSAMGFGDAWGWTEYGDWFEYGKCNFTHDLGRAGVNAARQTLQDFGGNICFGHTHRGGIAYQGTTRGETHTALNVGWAGDFKAIDYYHRAKALRDWQHGLGQVTYDRSGFCWLNFLPILKGRLMINGHQISAKEIRK